MKELQPFCSFAFDSKRQLPIVAAVMSSIDYGRNNSHCCLCCSPLKQKMAGRADVLERDLLLAIYREVTSNAGHTGRQPDPEVRNSTCSCL